MVAIRPVLRYMPALWKEGFQATSPDASVGIAIIIYPAD
jgi:hypothetical protein